MNWELLSSHFRQTLAGGYRYLDRCGEFLLEAEKDFEFTTREIKPSGAAIEIPEIGLKADVDTDSIAVVQELPDANSRFLEISIGLVEIAWKHFSPSSALRNGMASKWVHRMGTDELAARSSLSEMHPVVDRIADIVGMTPFSFNGGFSLKAGSRTLNILVAPGALESTRRFASAPIGSTVAMKKKQERQNLRAQRRDPLSGFALILEIDLHEEDPPTASHSKQLTTLFNQLRDYEQALKTFFQRHV